MSGLGWLVVLFLASKAKTPGLVPASTARKAVKGKSGRTWFVLDSTRGANKTPVREVFATATGQDMVISFAVMPGSIRARLFVSPSSLAPIALKDFDVQDVQARL